jgi:hypothetical protein
MVQQKDAIAEPSVGHHGSAQLLGWPHQASLEVPSPEVLWLGAELAQQQPPVAVAGAQGPA